MPSISDKLKSMGVKTGDRDIESRRQQRPTDQSDARFSLETTLGGQEEVEVAGALEGTAHAGDADVCGEVVARAVAVGDHRAETGINDSRTRPVTGEHVVGAAFVRRFAVAHGTDDRELVGDLGETGQRAAEHLTGVGVNRAQFATDLDRRVGLGVEGVQVAHAAGEEDEDRPLRFRIAGKGLGLGFA